MSNVPLPATTLHRCRHCLREFARAEHLVRHERTHTKEKPYACHHCSDAFSRRDLLRRHEIKAHGISEGLRRRKHSGNSPDVNSTMLGIYPSSQTVETFMVDGRSNGSPDTQNTVDTSSSLQCMLNELGSSTIQPPLDIDMVLGNQWLDLEASSEINLDFLSRMDDSHTRTYTTNPDLTHSLTLDLANEPAHLRNQSTDFDPHGQTRPSTSIALDSESPSEYSQSEENLTITEDYWHSMQTQIDQIGGPKLPSRTKLNQYIHRYLACFHRHQPLFHGSTWVLVECPVPLTLAVCANGALYNLERKIAVALFHAAVDLSKLAKKGISSLQLSMLLIAFAAWSGDTEDLDIAMQFHGCLALDLRREWTKVVAAPNFDNTTWAEWREREILKRTTYCCFTVMNLMSVAYDITSQLRLEDEYSLPGHEEQWCAANEEAWTRATYEAGLQEWRTAESVIRRLADASSPVPTRIGMFSCHVIMSSLCQKIMLLRKSCHPGSQAYNEGRHYFSRCLARWQMMWESEPQSFVSPDHPRGPMMFNSTALLRVAYIRLATDHSPIRNRFVTGISDADIAAGIGHMKPLTRDVHTHEAVMQACQALRVPARLGFTVICRSAFWTWSVQHALSYFECALMLWQWLNMAKSATDLTADEIKLQDMIEQLVDSSTVAQNGEQAQHSLSVRTLRLFVSLLDTGDLTVWGLSPKMARVLDACLKQTTDPAA
ncbi:hypothetical protein BKA56DRAFT_589963 [Ilyonectria sp. MPI-CAGE-AT-0026]|nr:hypothetical protein BKA56DRAFT_589963 [Ilyonectria sp. MPI-CAGE-AT-0026]